MANGLFALLLILIIWLPLPFGSNRLWAEATFFITTSLLGSGILIAIYLKKLRPPKTFLYSKYLQLCFLGLSLWQIIQSQLFASVNSHEMQQGLYLTFSYWMLFNCVLALTNNESRLNILLWVIIGSGLFQACYGTLMTLSGIEWGFGPKTRGHGTATGTFPNRNNLAFYLELTLACGLGMLIGQLKERHFQSTRERIEHYIQILLSNKVILRVAIGAMVIGLIMTRSRMGNAAFFSSMIISGLLYMWIRQRFTRNALILFASLILIDTLIVSQWFGLEKLAGRLSQTINQVELADNSQVTHQQGDQYLAVRTGDVRDEAFREALPMLKDHGVTGRGHGSFTQLFPQYKDGSTVGFFNHAHNDYIELINDFGLVGFAFLAAILIQAFIMAIKAQKHRHNPLSISAGFAAMMGIISMLIHSWVDFNLYIPANASLLCVLLALAVIGYHGKLKKD